MTVYDVLHPYVPDRWQRPFWRLYFGLTPHLGLPIPVARMCGPLRPHGRPASIAVAGRSAWFCPYLARTLFLSPPAVEPAAPTTLWGLSARLRELRAECDAAWALLDDANAGWALAPDHLRLPAWVNLLRPAPQAAAELEHQSESAVSDLRIVRRERLRASISRQPRDLDRFYADYHVPTIRARHGEQAFVHSMHSMRKYFRTGFLLWIEKDGERIAGSLVGQRDGVLKLWAIGLRGAELGLAQQGAYGAVYYFTCKQARELGAHTIDFGGCRPLLSDGLLRFKRKWGGTVGGPLATSHHDLALSWGHFSPVIADLLAELSVVFRDGGGLSALSALDTTAPATTADATRRHHLLWTPGLRRLFLVSRAGWQPGTAAPPDCVLLAPDAIGSSASCLSR